MQRLKQRNFKKLYKPPQAQDYSSNYKKLVIVILISFAFIAGQLIAGLISHSIAIISDAIHLISDTISFFTSFLFLYLSRRRSNDKMTFGYHRMELLGAIANIFIIWVLIFYVLYESTKRIIDREFVQEPMVMLISAGGGLIINIVMYKVLHNGANHSHGLLSNDCDHNHGHSHEKQHKANQIKEEIDQRIPNLHKSVTEPYDLKNPDQQCFQDICQDADCNLDTQAIHCHKNSNIHKHESRSNNLLKSPLLKHHRSEGKAQNQVAVARYRQFKGKSNIEEILIKKYCQQNHQHSNQCYLSPQIIQKSQHKQTEEKGERHLHKHQGKQHECGGHKHSLKGPRQAETLDNIHNLKSQPQNIHHKHKHHDNFHSQGHKNKNAQNHEHRHQGSAHCHQHEHKEKDDGRSTSIGMQAAVLHALSDMIMSIGLIISSLFIFFFGNPGKEYDQKVTEWNPWHLFDPVSTYIFSIVALGSTIPVIRNSYHLIMESTPPYIDLAQLKTKCMEIDGVIDIHDIHVWDLKPGKTCMIAHVLAKKGTERRVLVQLSDLARHNKIFHSTFQVQQEEWKNQDSYILCHHDIH